MKNQKSSLALCLTFALGLISAACSSSTTGTTTTTNNYYHVIIERFGIYGYYDNTNTGYFCSFQNNYCGTGLSYGITDNGCAYLGGYACDYPTNGGNYGGVGYQPTYPTVTPIVTYPITPPTINSIGTGGYSVAASTKDSALQRAQLAHQDLTSRAQLVANQFQMSFEGALELTQLADTMQKLSAQNKFTGEDQLAISQTALSVAGIKQSEFQAAMAGYLKNHDQTGFNALIDQGAHHLGMPSSSALRDQILPSLGLNVNAL